MIACPPQPSCCEQPNLDGRDHLPEGGDLEGLGVILGDGRGEGGIVADLKNSSF